MRRRASRWIRGSVGLSFGALLASVAGDATAEQRPGHPAAVGATPELRRVFRNPSSEQMRGLLTQVRRVAVVGLSDRPERPSFHVAEYLRAQGYEVIPVNPTLREWQGLRCYASLRDVPGAIDLVNVFRRSAEVGPIVEEAIAVGARSLWMQLGVANTEAALRAQAAGLTVVENRCILVEHQRHFGPQ